MTADLTQNRTKGELEETEMLQNILNSKTFLISLLTTTCISVLVNIVLIIYVCLKIRRNRYKVSESGRETVRFGPPDGKGATADIEGTNDVTPTRSINNGSAEGIALKPVNAIYERIPDPVESPSPKEPHPYATPLEGKSDPSPKAQHSREQRPSPKVSRLQHHYQDLDDFTLVLNQQEYQSLDKSEAASNPHPKHGPVSTPWKYETLTLTKREKPSNYQKLHVYSNVKDAKTEGDKQSQKSTFK